MNHASLFSGIGGPEIAAAMLGWDNVFHCEINDFGRKILEYWFPNSQSYEDIKTTNFKQWRGKVDVLTGGFPCQPFSYAGQRRGADDDRYLWPQMLRAIEECRPAWVVGENVAGIVSMVEQGTVSHLASQATLFDEGDGVQRYRQEQTFTIERVCRDLEGFGYSVQPILVPACAVGAPHRRDRVFIIANSADTELLRLQHDLVGRSKAGVFGTKETRGQDCISEQVQQLETNGKRRKATTNSECNGWFKREFNNGFSNEAQQTKCREIKSFGTDCTQDWWMDFPTVSPVCGRNDGISALLDSASISYGKWRTESLKAYGNAIVPQVMYEIFRAIQIVENQLNKC